MGNTYGGTVGVSVSAINAAVSYSVTVSFGITAGTTWTPVGSNSNVRGEIVWQRQYNQRNLNEQQWQSGSWLTATHIGYADFFVQPYESFVPAGTVLTSNEGTFKGAHWEKT